MTKFKQMVGRGTRLAQESGKELVTIVDFTGVTGLFADNTFDGLPSRNVRTPSDDEELPPEPIVEEESDADAESAEVAEPPGDFEIEPGGTLDDRVLDLGDGAIIDDEELERRDRPTRTEVHRERDRRDRAR